MAITIFNEKGNATDAMTLEHSELVKAVMQSELIYISELNMCCDADEHKYLRTIQKIVQLIYKYNPNVNIYSNLITPTEQQKKLSLTQQIVNSLSDGNHLQTTDYKQIAHNALLLASKLGVNVTLK